MVRFRRAAPVTDPSATGERLPRSFYRRPADVVARELLGCILEVASGQPGPGGVRRVRVVETEAYLGERDLACHASRGRTKRTAVMYGPPGDAYIYLIYGLHRMLNAVCAERGEPHAVLIRAAEPLPPPGETAPATPASTTGRTDGPGRLTATLGVPLAWNGTSLVHGPLGFRAGRPPARVACGRRIGVDYAGSWADAPLRFGDADSAWLSRPFRSEGS